MSLSEAKVRNAKPKSKPYKMYDGDGLFLLVTSSGNKYWRFRYHFAGKEKLLQLGVYPELGLNDAREKRGHAQKMLASGIDPSEARRQAKQQAVYVATNTFEIVAREWYGQRTHEWTKRYALNVLDRLERHALPRLGHRPIAELNAPEILSVLRVVEGRGTLEMARRVSHIVSQVFMYAIVTGRAERNPVSDLRGALKTPVVKHHAHLSEAELPEYLEKLENFDGSPLTKLAIKLLVLTFVRTVELRGAMWSEMNWEKAEWRIPAERMKMKEQHIVPLSRQAILVLRDLQKLSGNRQFVFPNEHNPSKFMSENTVLYALYRMGYHKRATGHGFRSTASTILNENGFRPDVIERQLAHSERNSVRAAYNHAQYLPERREMMQWWADFVDQMAAKKPSK